MDILFIGRPDAAYQLKKWCVDNNRLFTDFGKEPLLSLADITEEVLSLAPKYLVLDLTVINDETDDLIDSLQMIQKGAHTKIAIVAINYTLNMLIINTLITGGLHHFILSENLTKQYREIDNFFHGIPTIGETESQRIINQRENTISQLFTDVPETQPINKATLRKKIKIAVVGCRDRIGTTTVALQLAKYLTIMDKSCCYLERNNSGFVETFAEYIDGAKISPTGKLTYDEIEMWFKPEALNRLLQADYEYYIYDYGNIEIADTMSMLEQDIIIAVCGNFPTELKNNDELYNKVENHSAVFYLFNFIDKQDHENILTYQGNRASQTFFFASCSDPFLYRPEHEEFFAILTNYDNTPHTSIQVEKKRKRGFRR